MKVQEPAPDSRPGGDLMPKFVYIVAMFTLSFCAAWPAVAADQNQAQAFADDSIPIRGVIRALDQAALSTDLVTRVIKLGYREGEAFKKGDLLIAFDCERYRAETQAADAVSREMQATLDSNQQLEKFRAVGKNDVEISKARVDKAAAEARSLQSRLSQCDVIAPFDGRVAELSVNLYEQPQPNKPFLVVVGLSRLEIEVIVPSRWLNWIKPGSSLSFLVDETNHKYQARIARIGAAVDAVSQMVKVIATFDTPAIDVLPGMSGSIQFPHPNG